MPRPEGDPVSPDTTRDQAWKVLKESEVFRAKRRMRITCQTVQLPDNRVIDDYYRIYFPEAVIIVAVTKDRKVVMTRQYNHGYGRVSILLPAGTIEDNDDPLATARRELLEEAGYVSARWRPLGSYWQHTNYGCGKLHVFLALDAVRTAEPASGDLEEMEIVTLPVPNIAHAIRAGDIVSIGTITALTLAKLSRRAPVTEETGL
jgi:ADP-ribose pyrophosphatase